MVVECLLTPKNPNFPVSRGSIDQNNVIRRPRPKENHRNSDYLRKWSERAGETLQLLPS